MARQGNSFNQIIRLDGRNVFVECLDVAFEIGKVLINFVKYDSTTKKQTGMVSYYLDIEDFLVLKHDVLSGKMSGLQKKYKVENGVNWGNPIYKQQGGTSAKSLALKGKSRPDKMSEARQFLIISGDKAPFILQAEKGKGQENEKGLIVPRYGTSPDVRVAVPMQANDLKKLVLMVDLKIQAYYAAQYVYLYKEQFNRQAKEELDKRAKYAG